MVDKNIQKHLDKLEHDLLQLPNVTKVEYDLLGYNDGMHGPITLVSYDIPTTGEPVEYFNTLRDLKKQVLKTFKENGVEVELDEFEDNDTYFYIVSYNTNWDSEKLTELYDPMEGKGVDLAHDLTEYMQEYDWYEYVDQYAEDEEAFNDMLDTLSDKDRRQDTMIWFEDVIQEMKENGDSNLEWTEKLLARLKEFDKEMDAYELDNLNEAKTFEDYEEEIYYLQDVIDDYERNGRGTEAGYKYAVSKLDKINSLLNENKKVEATFKDKVKAIKKSLKDDDKRLSDKTAEEQAKKIAGSMIKNESKGDTKYIVCSYYDDKLHGLEEELMTDDWSEVQEFAHTKLMEGNVIEIENTVTGKYIRLNPDEYIDNFDGVFEITFDELEESKSLKTEGVGAGYEISGNIAKATVNSFNVVEETGDDYNYSTYVLECDIDVEIDDLHFSSYYHGSNLDFTTSGKLTTLTIEDNGNNEDEPELTSQAIQQALDGAEFKEMIGGGWAHTTFDGNITGEFDGNAYDDFYVSDFTMKLTNKEVVRFIDEKVSGEVDETTYEVFDKDGDLLDTFKDEDEAIKYAEENNASQVVEVIHDFTLTDEEGSVDDDPSFETVWSVEDLDEGLIKKHSKKLKEGFGKHDFSEEFLQKICDKLITYLWIDMDDIDYDDNGIITFKYNGNTFYAEPTSLFQIDVYDANKNKIGYGLKPEEIKLELFTDFDEDDYRYRLVGGKYARDYGDEYTRAEAKRLPICLPDTVSNPAWRKELQNQLQFKGYLGPMFDGYNDEGQPIIRYETQEVYDTLSESKKQEREARGQVEISESKQKFIDYCEGKIEDLGYVSLPYNLYDGDSEYVDYKILMTSDAVRQYKDVKIVFYDPDLFTVVDKNNKLVINTPMIGPDLYAIRMEFNKIDKQYYKDIIDTWEDGDFDEYFVESKEYKTEAEDMTQVKDEVERAAEETDNTELELDQVQGSLDVLKTDEESAIAGYDTFIEDTKQVVDKELANALDDQMQEIIDDEKEHIEKIDTIKNALEKEDTNKIEEVKVIGETEDEEVAEDVIEDKSEEDVIDNEREIDEKSIEDYLNERVGQELEVGRLNSILQGIFGMYNKIFILPSDLYNMDLTQDHNIYVVDDDNEYTIWYDIVSLEDGLVKITNVEVL